MNSKSAGILLYRILRGEPQVLLVHPGGPFFKDKDAGFWSIPKGSYAVEEDPKAAAIREFFEETGTLLPSTTRFYPLGHVKQKGGKVVQAWAAEGDLDAAAISSNMFALQWPKNTGTRFYPEIDKAAWFSLEKAKSMINKQQIPLLDELRQMLSIKTDRH